MKEFQDFLTLLKIQIKKPKGERWAVLSTFGEQYPKARNIIIRDITSDNRIIFFTHSLSNKIEEITKNPYSSICWYTKRHSVQLQLYGKTAIANDEIIKAYKSRVNNFRDYQGPKPGSDLSSIFKNETYFSVLEFKIEEMIALKLGIESHQKYKFNLVDEHINFKEIVP